MDKHIYDIDTTAVLKNTFVTISISTELIKKSKFNILKGVNNDE